ncbi:MAG: DNA replication/repair protein RecF [Pseudomonadota bacterium]
MSESDGDALPRATATFVERLELRRFRSHRAFIENFEPGPIAIYGPNGAGKTNILEAVSILAPGRGLRGARAELLAGRPDPIGWTVKARLSFGGDPSELTAQLDLRPGASDRGKRRVTLDGAPISQAALANQIRALWLTPAMDRLWIEGASERRRFLDRITLGFDPDHGAQSAEYERAMRERNRLLKESRDAGATPPSAWLDALEDRMAQAACAITASRSAAIDALAQAQQAAAQQAGASEVFPKADLAIQTPDGLRPEANVDVLRERFGRGRRTDAAAGRTLCGPHRDDLSAIYAAKGLEAGQCSTGEQKALLISLILAAARAQTASTGPTPLLLLDEVAAHLDDGRRAALYQELTLLGVQAWLTGTGPELFSSLADTAQMLNLAAIAP